jgi:hypothetical protein
MVYSCIKYYVLMYENGWMRLVKTILRTGRGEKGERWRGEFN